MVEGDVAHGPLSRRPVELSRRGSRPHLDLAGLPVQAPRPSGRRGRVRRTDVGRAATDLRQAVRHFGRRAQALVAAVD